MPAMLTIDGLEGLQDLYDGVQEDFEDISFLPVMQEELDHIADLELGLFDRSQSPDGSVWAPNAPSTIRQKGHSVVLRGVLAERNIRKSKTVKSKQVRKHRRFRLANSLTTKARQSTGDAIREAVESSSGAALAFGTSVEYSVFNEDRPHVGVNEQYLDKACGRVADHAIKQLAKG